MEKNRKKDIIQQIDRINLPVKYPKQVYLRKGDEYISSYDPVWSIKIKDNNLHIEGSGNIIFIENINDFDKIYVTQGEPVELKK